MSRKELYKFLTKESKKLPPETYIAYPKEFQIPEWVEEEVMRKGIKAEPILFKTEVHYMVNHKRRLKQAYKMEGWHGIVDYFNKRGFEIKNK